MKKTKLLTALLTLVLIFTSTVSINGDWYDYGESFVDPIEVECARETVYEIWADDTLYSRYEREFNDQGLCVKEIYSEDDGTGNVANYELVTFEYDDLGRIAKWDYYLYQNNEPVLTQTKTYEYHGETGTETLTLHEEDRDIIVMLCEVKFDSEGKEIYRSAKELNDQEELVLYYTRSKTYTDNGETYEAFYYEDGEIYDGIRQINTYDDLGRDLVTEEFAYNLETKKNDAFPVRLEYAYDKAQTEYQLGLYEDGILSNRMRYDYKLDENGYLKETSTIFEDEDFSMGIKDEYEHDKNGNISSTTFYDYDNGEWVYEGVTNYKYDERGLVTEEEDIFQYDDGDSKTYTKHEYELVHLDLKEVKEEGYKPYYHCDKCHKNYSDSKGQKIIYDLDAWKESHKESKIGSSFYVMIGIGVIAIVGFISYKKRGN